MEAKNALHKTRNVTWRLPVSRWKERSQWAIVLLKSKRIAREARSADPREKAVSHRRLFLLFIYWW
jgi:hypothetical protein